VGVLERAQHLVDLGGLEIELVEGRRDLVVRHESRGDTALDQQPGLFEGEHGNGRLNAHNVLLFAVIRDTPFDLHLAR
jgi:hypothetical protein